MGCDKDQIGLQSRSSKRPSRYFETLIHVHSDSALAVSSALTIDKTYAISLISLKNFGTD